MVGVDDIVAFLTARLDEDEAVAKAATPGPWRHNPNKHWRKPGTPWFEEAVFAGPIGSEANCVAGTGETDDPQSMADAVHIARHDPARVLAEIAAKRAIVALHAIGVDPCDAHDASLRSIACDTVRIHAAIYADHADYRDDWRPAL